MCFILDLNYPDVRTANRDIVCYKVGWSCGSQVFEPFFMDYEYCLGQEQPRITLNLNDYNRIWKGYHSYSNKKCMYREWPKKCAVDYVKCIIPKGTKYYYNSYEKTYVSETIIVQEYIKP